MDQVAARTHRLEHRHGGLPRSHWSTRSGGQPETDPQFLDGPSSALRSSGGEPRQQPEQFRRSVRARGACRRAPPRRGRASGSRRRGSSGGRARPRAAPRPPTTSARRPPSSPLRICHAAEVEQRLAESQADLGPVAGGAGPAQRPQHLHGDARYASPASARRPSSSRIRPRRLCANASSLATATARAARGPRRGSSARWLGASAAAGAPCSSSMIARLLANLASSDRYSRLPGSRLLNSSWMAIARSIASWACLKRCSRPSRSP